MNYFVKNIDYFMACNNIHSYTELASVLKINLSTLKSLLKNPKSNSKLKPLIAEFFGVTINQLDNYDFSSFQDYNSTNTPNDSEYTSQACNTPLEAIDTSTLLKEFLKDNENEDEEIKDLKKTICEKFFIEYKMLVLDVKELKNNRMYDKALLLFYDKFLKITDETLKTVTKDELNGFIDLFEKTNSENMLEKFVLRFVNSYCVSVNVLFYLSEVLMKEHAELSKECLRRIKSYDDIF